MGDVVKHQIECGLDSICNGEFGKQNFTSYVGSRIAGYEPGVVDPERVPPPRLDRPRPRRLPSLL